MIKAVLFDLDGTFADTAPDLAAALNKCRADQKLPELPLEEVRLQTSNGANALIKLGFDLNVEDEGFAELKDNLLNNYSNNIAQHTTLFEGIEELINYLDQNNLSWGIVTNKPERFTLPLMEALKITDRTNCIVSGDTTAHSKPHPEPLLYAAKLLGLAPYECLYIGDAERDIQAARNAGMKSLIALFGYIGMEDEPEHWHADGMINHAMQTLDYLKLS
ncbi:MAG: HAD-IA family hydrolase [Gammaproteobacteria bacterium]